MRITGGTKRGFIIKRVLSDDTRETSDMVKVAVFNMLGNLDKKVVLDLFSGSGAYGLEAFSRGAEHITFVDKQRKAIDVIKENIHKLNVPNYQVLQMDYKRFLSDAIDCKFDLIFLDPPYNLNVYEEVIKTLEAYTKDESTIVCELIKSNTLPDRIGSFSKQKEKNYGIKKVIIYEKM